MFCDADTSHRLEVVRLFAKYLVCSTKCIARTVLAGVSLNVTACVVREILVDLWQ